MATKKTEEANLEDVVEQIEPTAKEIKVVVGDLEFTQKPLSFFRKIEFFAIAGKAIESILGSGGSVEDLLGTLDDTPADIEQGKGTDAFVRGIALVVQHVPEILPELYCVILGVEKNKREEVKEVLENDLDDEKGFKILEDFVEQNWEVLANFFSKGILPLVQKVQNKV